MSTSAKDRSPLASPIDRPRHYRPALAADGVPAPPAMPTEDGFATRAPGLARGGRASARNHPAPIAPPPSPASPRVLLLAPGEGRRAAHEPLERALRGRGIEVQHADRAADGIGPVPSSEQGPPEVVLVDPAFPWTVETASALNRLWAPGSEHPAPLLMLLAEEPADSRHSSLAAMLDQLDTVIRSRRAAISEERLVWRDLTLDAATQRLQRGETAHRLTGKAFVLLRHLMRTPAHVHTRAELLTALWGPRISVAPRTLDVHIRRLRLTLCATSADPVIYTVRGIGYTLDPRA